MRSSILNSFPLVKKILSFLFYSVSYRIGKFKIRLYKNKYKQFVVVNDILPDEYSDYESFGGYYDKDLFRNGKLIVNLTKKPTKCLPDPAVPILLVVVDVINKNLLFKTEVFAYNWQQGCRAHWIGDNQIIFNNFIQDEKRYVSIIYDLSSHQSRLIPFPVEDSYLDKYILSLNFNRLNALRPDYGYRNLPKMTHEELCETENDGIWFYDLKTNQSKLIISLHDVINFDSDEIINSQQIHKVNHFMISPNGEFFVFIHRCFPNGKRYDRLLLAKITGEIVCTLAHGMVSHLCWMDNKHILGYMRNNKGEDGYNIVNIESQTFCKSPERFPLYGDGHPTFKNNQVLTDTYPDKFGIQHLLLYDYSKSQSKEIACFFHSKHYKGETRCDLHPRFSENGSISLDSVNTGTRHLYFWLA